MDGQARQRKKRPRITPAWLIRARDLAELLGVGPRTLTRMIQQRKIGPKRIIAHRRSIGWDRAEIEVWLRVRGPDGQFYDEESWARIRDAMMAQHHAPQQIVHPISTPPIARPALPSLRSASSEDTAPNGPGKRGKRD